MITHIELGDISVDVVHKDIKNVHLSVYPPAGRVRIAAPLHMSVDTIRLFAISKLGWIKQQQTKLRQQEREAPREYLDRESHYVWGKRYLLTVVERDAAPSLDIQYKRLVLSARPKTTTAQHEALLDGWYREQIREALPSLIAKWEPTLGVKVNRIFIQRMKTKWGSCNSAAGNIRVNTDLAKKPRECLEYILVHELAHLLEPTHNARFISILDRVIPNWQSFRAALNELPVRHERWS